MKLIQSILALVLIIGSVSAEPWNPEPRPDEWWQNAHASFVARTENSNGNIRIVFVGASITNWWPQNIWNQYFEPLGAVNYGLSGDGSAQALWRLQNGEIDGIANSVKLVVYADCGSNDVGGGWSGSDISRGTQEIINTIKNKLPNSKILILGLMPRDNGNLDRNSRLIDTNIRNSKFSSDSNIVYLDLWTQFASSWLNVDPNLFDNDQLHLTGAGYQKWAEVISPAVRELSQ